MVKEIIESASLDRQKVEPATTEDVKVAQDLLDTLKANQYSRIGMSANMIGVNKRIIVVNAGIVDMPMLNPRIINKAIPYDAREECRSFDGSEVMVRYDVIEVEYQDMDFRKQKQTFTGWLAHLIQHEIDRCEGELAG